MPQPLSVRLDRLARMVTCELTDDPHYSGLEVQVFDDDVPGTGVLVFLQRRADRRVDVSHQRGLRVDPAGHWIGGDGAGTVPRRSTPPSAGRAARAARRTWACATRAGAGWSSGWTTATVARAGLRVLAPAAAAVEAATELMLVWMTRFDLVRRSAQPPTSYARVTATR